MAYQDLVASNSKLADTQTKMVDFTTHGFGELKLGLQNVAGQLLKATKDTNEKVNKNTDTLAIHGGRLSSIFEEVNLMKESNTDAFSMYGNQLSSILDEMSNIKGTLTKNVFCTEPKIFFYSNLHALFDTSKGFCAVCPVSYKGHFFLVLSMNMLVTAYGKYADHRMSEMETRAFFGSSFNIPLYEHDFTTEEFRISAIGKNGRQGFAANKMNFIIADAQQFKAILRKVELYLPNYRKTPLLQSASLYDGNDYAFRCKSETDHSSGPILQYCGRSFSRDEKMRTPAMGKTWVTEWLTPTICGFYGVPEHLVGKRHIVCSKVDLGAVVTEDFEMSHGRNKYVAVVKAKGKRKRAD